MSGLQEALGNALFECMGLRHKFDLMLLCNCCSMAMSMSWTSSDEAETDRQAKDLKRKEVAVIHHWRAVGCRLQANWAGHGQKVLVGSSNGDIT